jgi:3'-phosphoadenosine 5'-phosphosulfate sulfotransferase (PAPS reductase)/FAD synthetase
MMLERGEDIHSVVWFDTGWEFPQMAEHVAQIEELTGLEVITLRPGKPFTYWMLERPVRFKSGEKKGQVRWIGRGWPSAQYRWCTTEKKAAIAKYANQIEGAVQCIGYASDEAHRTETDGMAKRADNVRFPLIEWDISEAEALAYCKARGFTWGGLYEHFPRVSCFCCPLKSLPELRKLRKHFPALWAQMLEWDEVMPNNRGFNKYATVRDLEARFAEEDRMQTLPGVCVA